MTDETVSMIDNANKALSQWDAWFSVEGNYDKKNVQHASASSIASNLQSAVGATDETLSGLFTTSLKQLCKGITPQVFRKGGSKIPFSIGALIDAEVGRVRNRSRAYATENPQVLTTTKLNAKTGGGTIAMQALTLEQQIEMYAEIDAHSTETLYRKSYIVHAAGKASEPNTYAWDGKDMVDGVPVLTYTPVGGGES